MKTILLLRHSEPQRGTGLPNARIPLSSSGESRVKQLFQAEEFTGVGMFIPLLTGVLGIRQSAGDLRFYRMKD